MDTDALTTAAKSGRLVVFAGAGISMGAPTNLPSWRDVNRIVVRALASTAAEAVGDAAAASAADLILARHQKEKLPPEYQAQLLAESLHDQYFDVLRYIDSDQPNATHLSIAWLARLGCVGAVITTNFDRVLETAFAAVNTPLEIHYKPEHFQALVTDLGRLDRTAGCHLLKLHGSVDDPQTLIDTLAQRKQGFAAPVVTCVSHLLRSRHWLFLGFSGLDLEAEPNYLGLSQESETALGFTWFVREKTQPKPAVLKLKERYGSRGEIVYGELPDWLVDFASTISPEPRVWMDDYLRRASAPAPASPTSALETGASAWAASVSPNRCAMSLAFLVVACAEPQAAATLVERILVAIDQRQLELGVRTEGSLLMKALAANALGIVLGGLGRHEEAVRWLTLAVDTAERADDDDTRDRWRGNLAASLETLGRIDEARAMYESALAGFRTRDDPVPLAFGLTALASHLIRQMRLEEAKALAMEAIEHAGVAGDERLRGTALNDVGMIAKLKGEYADALEIFTEVEQLFDRLGNDEAVAAAAGNRGEVLAALGQFDEAERIQMSALAVLDRLERRDNQGATYLSLGLINQYRGDAATAEQWFSRARDTFRAIKDPSNEAFALYRIASLSARERQFERAIEIAQSALPLVSGRNPLMTCDLWAQIGQANLQLGFVGRAEPAFLEAIAIARQIGAEKPLAGSEQNMGTALLLQQRNDEAAAAFGRAAEIWEREGDTENRDYCKLCIAAVRLDTRIGELSDAGHSATDPQESRAAAREMFRLYPELIDTYQQIGAHELVAAFCLTAASTAKFIHEDARAVEWYRQAAALYRRLNLNSQARNALANAHRLLQPWVNALLRADDMAGAVPVLLQLADVAGELGEREAQATALYNAAIAVLQTSQDVGQARAFAEAAAGLYDPASSDGETARKLVAFCDAKMTTPSA